METKHTPTPWKSDGNNFVGENGRLIDFNTDEGNDEVDLEYYDQNICDRNFALRAVNSHEELLLIALAYTRVIEGLPYGSPEYEIVVRSKLKEVKAAVAKAQGK